MRSIFELYDSEEAVKRSIDTSINSHINLGLGNKIDLNKIDQLKPGITADTKCDKMFPWQQQFFNLLQQTGDHYILSLPGTGKTLPVICHWNNLIGIDRLKTAGINARVDFLSNPQTLPKILWLTPIQSLNGNIATELENIFINLIIQIVENDFNITPEGNLNINRNILGALTNNDNRNYLARMNTIITNNDTIVNEKIIEFKNLLNPFIKAYIHNSIIGIKQQGADTVENGKPINVSIYESAPQIIDKLNGLRLIIFDEGQRVQGGNAADISRAEQIGEGIYKTLTHTNGQHAQLIMMSGTAKIETAANVTHFFNIAYKRRFPDKPFVAPDRNPSNIRVEAVTNLNNFQEQLSIAHRVLSGRTTEGEGVVFIIFSKAQIDKLVDKLAPQDRSHQTSENFGNLHRKAGEHRNKTQIFSPSDIRKMTSAGDIADIHDDKLRRAVSNGIGFLYRPKDTSMGRETQKDMAIVQELFKRRIIKILFTTDSIREGINVDCNTIYIPTITLPGNNQMTIDGLCQLLNRVGRKHGTLATIKTSPEFVKPVTDALNAEFNNFQELPFLLPEKITTKSLALLRYATLGNVPTKAQLKALGLAYLTSIAEANDTLGRNLWQLLKDSPIPFIRK
jgi:hypothetical protein